MYHLEPIDFGRRMAGEKELLADEAAPQANAIFDESGNFIIYATLLGIKVGHVALTMLSSKSAAHLQIKQHHTL